MKGRREDSESNPEGGTKNRATDYSAGEMATRKPGGLVTLHKLVSTLVGCVGWSGAEWRVDRGALEQCTLVLRIWIIDYATQGGPAFYFELV